MGGELAYAPDKHSPRHVHFTSPSVFDDVTMNGLALDRFVWGSKVTCKFIYRIAGIFRGKIFRENRILAISCHGRAV